MVAYITKKITYGILVLWGVLTLVFFLFNVLPGDPARMMLDKREDANQLAVIKQKYAFDRSLSDQYALYLNDVLPLSIHHNSATAFTSLTSGKYQFTQLFSIADYALVFKVPYLRESFVRIGTPVTSILGNTFKNTFVLALSSIGIALFLGLILGVFSALYKDTFIDKFILFISLVFYCVNLFIRFVTCLYSSPIHIVRRRKNTTINTKFFSSVVEVFKSENMATMV